MDVDLLDDVTAHTYIGDSETAVALLVVVYLQLAALTRLAKHDEAALGRHGVEDEERHLPQSLVERGRGQERHADLRDEREQVTVLSGGRRLRRRARARAVRHDG